MLKGIIRILHRIRSGAVYYRSAKRESMLLDSYVKREPSPQNAVDIMKGEWSSKIPLDGLISGDIENLFDDGRIEWANNEMGGLDGLSVLEVGPLEGAHTYMLEKYGAKEIIAVESNKRAFLKCLIVKEILGLKKCRFMLGDIMEFLLANQDGKFDFVVASGVLYHMQDPLMFLKQVSNITDRLLLWTHYYDSQIVQANPVFASHFQGEKESVLDGFRAKIHVRRYSNKELFWKGFCGGGAPVSSWLDRQTIMDLLHHFGFKTIKINFDDRDHPNGPSFALMAWKT